MKFNMKFNSHNLKLIFLLVVFILGLYYYINQEKLFESMENNDTTNENKNLDKRCPNMMIEKDGQILLYNSNLASVPGVNPIQFNNLDEYSQFIKWQNSQDINCPVLYLQYSTDTQNNDLIKIKPDLFSTHGGLPEQPSNSTNFNSKQMIENNKILDATINGKFNKNMYQSFDSHNQNIGLDTPLDKIFNSNEKKSPNPMDTNWGGKKYTQNLVDSGKYCDRYVFRHNLENDQQ